MDRLPQDPAEAYLCALDEWGEALVVLHAGPTSGVERDHRELMLRRSRANLEIALRHLLGLGPRRSQSARMPAVEVLVEKDEKDRR